MKFIIALAAFCIFYSSAWSVTKITSSGGNWNNPSLWLPSGVPQNGDDVIIQGSHVVMINDFAYARSVTVKPNAQVLLLPGMNLKLSAELNVQGKFLMNSGDIGMEPNGLFVLGPGSEFNWDPATNTSAGASLFTNSSEQFDSTSTLVIKKWFDYASTPLGAVITGGFGNLTLNTMQGNLLMEWNQDNYFESHKIYGTLAINQGWIVLDKSGSISNTTIGKIKLLNYNSYLDFHGGSHPSQFTVSVQEIENTGGHLSGIYNGNGGITLHVAGNFMNYGYAALIYNTGIQGVGNGNAVLNVDGDFIQSFGDFRAIFNLTTFNCGTSHLNIGNLFLNGGIFMAQYACHSAGGTNILQVNNNLEINFSKQTDKFRVNGLTSLSGIFSTAKSQLIVHGNMAISGHPSSEFTSSGSVGAESIQVDGNILVSGCNSNINMGSHATSFTGNGNMMISGGTFCFSKSPGSATIVLNGNLELTGGSVSLKGHTGNSIMNLSGNFIQSGGFFFLRNNVTVSSTDPSHLIIQGDFSQNGGTLVTDDNASGSAVNELIIKGANYTLGGNGYITRYGSAFGQVRFARNGSVAYRRTSVSHNLQLVKQIVDSGCTLDIVSGNLQLSSSLSPDNGMLQVRKGAVIRMNTSKIISNLVQSHSGITVFDGGRISTQHTNGFYNGSENACINATGNMNYFLFPKSIIEYNGVDTQILTGIGSGLATGTAHKYGILEINFNGTADVEKVQPDKAGVIVRSALILTKGELFLNNFPIVIESGDAEAIQRTFGYIKSDNGRPDNNSFITWKNMGAGDHVFPFGCNTQDFIPFTFTPISGMGGTVSIATRNTGPDNLPFPSNFSAVSNLSRDGKDISVSSVIDRWYDIKADGFKANALISYRGIENTTADSLANATFAIQAWDGTRWTNSSGKCYAVRQGIGTISVNNMSVFNHWIIATKTAESFSNDFIDFTATSTSSGVLLSWTTSANPSIIKFFAERSGSNVSFDKIREVPAQTGNHDTRSYQVTDSFPLRGINYYRIKQINNDESFGYSHTEKVFYSVKTDESFEFLTASPNPFEGFVDLTFKAPAEGVTELLISNASGQLLAREVIEATEGINVYKFIPAQNLPAGVYVITLRYGARITSKKLYKS